MAMTNALLGTARLNNFRLNYLTAETAAARRTKVSIILAGLDVRARVRRGSVTIRDVINDAPNSADLAIEAPPVPPYAQTVLADNPVAYWRLGDVTAPARDQTGRGHTGTLIGGVTINQPGMAPDGDRAMNFPGVVGARIEVADAADLALTASVAVEAWVKTAQFSQQGGICEKTIGGGLSTSYLLYQEGTNWAFQIIGSFGTLVVSVPVDAADVGAWVHLVGLYGGAVSYLFRNGQQQASSPVAAGTLNAGAGVLRIGHLAGGFYPFAGVIDEVAIYPGGLNYLQIAAHYEAGRPSGAPTVAQSLRISIGVDDPTLLFNGTLSQVNLTYEGRPTQTIYHCSATDDTARANRRRPFGQWTNVSATTVAQQLIAQFAPGIGTAFVQAGLPPVTVIFDGSEGMNRCLTQVTNLIGGYWYFLDGQLHLFLTETTDAPDPVDGVHAFLNEPPITTALEMSQVRTRVFGRGHGEALLSAVLPAETILPIADTTMFSATGGKAIALSQVLAYTGRQLGGNGSLVGPGAGPSVAMNPTLAAGSGLGNGFYQYAYTNVTASGESLPGPIAAITVGPLQAPSAPIVGAPTVGSGPDPGTHQYAMTCVTASGETTPGPMASGTTGVTPAPSGAVIVGAATAGGSVDVGMHDYEVTFLTAVGETTPGPTGSGTTGVTPAPTSTPSLKIQPGDGPDVGAHDYVVTFITATGETLPSPATAQVSTFVFPPPANAPVVAQSSYAYYNPPPHRLTAGATYRYGFAFELGYGVGVTTMSPPSNPIVADATYGVNVYINYAGLAFNGVGATSVIYYRSVNGGPFHQFNYQQGGTYQSPIYDLYNGDADIAGTSPPPTVSTAMLKTIGLTGIPIGDANVTGRHLWRRFNGTGPFKSLDGILNNTATTYTDTAPNARLGAAAPTVSTAVLQTLPVTAIPIGDANVTARKLYRRFNGGGPFQLVAILANNTATTYLDTAPNASRGAAATVSNTAYLQRFPLTLPLGGPLVTSRKIYRTAAGASTLKLAATIADNVTTSWLDTVIDASLGAAAPVSNTATANQVVLSGIAVGAASVTARKIYRTVANGSQLKLLMMLGDNATLTYLDALGDGSLGANAPTGDTSGLTQPQGQVNAGSPTLPTASAGPFLSSGWVILGSQLVRYTGISGNTLTGIPPSGLGALITTVRYGDHVLAAPVLTGVSVPGGLTAPEGTPVCLWVQRDDLPAQAAMAARDGGDGIYEYLVQDERRGEPSITALCDAHLLAYKAPIATVTYATRDLKTKSGKAVSVDLPSPPIRGTLVIQDVSIDEIDLAPGLAPRFTVTASTVRLSLDDLLRQLTGTLDTL